MIATLNARTPLATAQTVCAATVATLPAVTAAVSWDDLGERLAAWDDSPEAIRLASYESALDNLADDLAEWGESASAA